MIPRFGSAGSPPGGADPGIISDPMAPTDGTFPRHGFLARACVARSDKTEPLDEKETWAAVVAQCQIKNPGTPMSLILDQASKRMNATGLVGVARRSGLKTLKPLSITASDQPCPDVSPGCVARCSLRPRCVRDRGVCGAQTHTSVSRRELFLAGHRTEIVGKCGDSRCVDSWEMCGW